MKYITAAEAARRIGVSERTVRMWIKQKKLNAYHVEKNRLAIPEGEVSSMAAERSQYERTYPDVSALIERIEVLERQQTALEKRIHTLETREKAIAPRTPATSPTTMKERRPHATAPTEAKGTLPEGLVAFTDFYKAHSISETTARRGLEGQCFPVISGPWHRGNSVIKQALDLSGQRAFCEYFSSKGKLHQCDRADCPCHTIAPQQ